MIAPPAAHPWINALPSPKPIVGPHNAAATDHLLHLGEAWYPAAPSVVQTLRDCVSLLPRYPDSLSIKLREALATYTGSTLENIIIGNGSDGLIDLLITAYAGPENPVVAPAPTFFVYGHAAALRQATLLTVGRRDQAAGFTFDTDAFIAALPERPSVIFLASPNNPTGDLIPLADIDRIASATTGIVVIDECYYEFAGETAQSLLAKHANLVILRSLSKSFALAGLRLGYAIAHPAIIETLAKVDQTFAVNAVAQACAITALASLDSYYRPLFEQTIALRGQYSAALAQRGLRVFPSRANILLADYSTYRSAPLAPALQQQGVHVADFHDRGMIKNCVRITVGDEPSLTALVQALDKSL